MKLSELKQIVDMEIENGNGDADVCIPNNEPSFGGGTPVTHILTAHNGFDWDKGKFILRPVNRMVVLKKKGK